ncbi:hypothetical protein DNU06_14725 [Putridiphycobacter roseus]|uniref:Reelin domain-containing protein n=1 Tax=Putridiphycobacter roseus TaxID=2219161 RepID=A0A2W1NK72_9FLAO|nr:choice-of-anchor V domain-containing protein [Putridiphycobacter roseus]PZE16052.1 hypothetical protein DNU06_14725 [Putridiphycobacter roseus]
MTGKIKNIFGLLCLSTFTLYSFYEKESNTVVDFNPSVHIQNFSSNPPTGKTGAPNESTCIDCHNGSVLSAIGVVDVSFSGLNNSYVPGQLYNLEVSVASGAKNGFEMTILDNNVQKAGDFVNGANTSTALAGGREYIRHSSSNGITSFQFQWTAPATEQGDLRAYFSFNKSNSSSSTSGDKIYVGSYDILSSVPASVVSLAENNTKVNVFWDDLHQNIQLNYQLNESAKLQVNVQSLNGKLIQSTTLGLKEPGQYQEVLATNIHKKGLYIVSVFVNNSVFNQKLMLN